MPIPYTLKPGLHLQDGVYYLVVPLSDADIAQFDRWVDLVGGSGPVVRRAATAVREFLDDLPRPIDNPPPKRQRR